MKIFTIVGARPQFIKAAMFSRAVQQKALQGVDVQEAILHTGQHYDFRMSETFFHELHIPTPRWNLGCTASPEEMAQHIIPVIQQYQPDEIVVFGDTNSTLAGAVAAHQCHCPLAHIEAGLRSRNMEMPEERNRIATDRLSNLLFCPTHQAVSNLQQEGITRGVHYVGDIMLDAALSFGAIADSRSTILQQLGIAPRQYILATIHRAGNTDNPSHLNDILLAVNQLDYPVILPIHPRTRKVIDAHPTLRDLLSRSRNIRCIEPVGYIDMVMLEKSAHYILTDSGGVQKEAYFHRVPCITLRNETEWTETVEAGWNTLAGTTTQGILDAYRTSRPHIPITEYGDGHTADTIIDILCRSTC